MKPLPHPDCSRRLVARGFDVDRVRKEPDGHDRGDRDEYRLGQELPQEVDPESSREGSDGSPWSVDRSSADAARSQGDLRVRQDLTVSPGWL